MAGSAGDPLRELSKDLGGISKDLRKQLRPGLKKAAQPVLRKARQNASWSKRIPGATRLSVRFAKKDPSVVIMTSLKKAPHAKAYENDGKRGKFRHPVFANRKKPRAKWTWVEQQARPFLAPAVDAKRAEVEKEIVLVVDDVLSENGFL